MDRPQLADFLRRRREALLPDDVGLDAGARRRTKGLRREEVALLAHMSTDYYSRLEQQRGPQPSEQMLSAPARCASRRTNATISSAWPATSRRRARVGPITSIRRSCGCSTGSTRQPK